MANLRSKRVTMMSLAKAANVDVATVSRALNDSPLVKPETKGRIRDIAAKLGYVINASARSLRRQSSEAIGIVIPMRPDSGQTISDPFFLEMVGAVSNAASKKGYDLIVSVPDSDASTAQRRLLQTGRADGLIIIGQAGRVDQLNALGPLSERVVVWGGKIAGSKYTVVGSDNEQGGELATDHLFDRGRRRILFIGDVSLPEVKLRFNGLLNAHQKRGLRHDPRLVLDQNFGGQETFDAVRTLLSAGLAFDAVFAASDVLAMAAMHGLQAGGRPAPADVSVVGYDNIRQASLVTPGLTTIDQSIALGGALLVELLLKKLSGSNVRSRATPTKLIVRGSS